MSGPTRKEKTVQFSYPASAKADEQHILVLVILAKADKRHIFVLVYLPTQITAFHARHTCESRYPVCKTIALIV
jgi:hypothetical protein